MSTTIHLHGRLRKEFGPEFSLAVRTPAEGVHALCRMVPGLEKALREGSWRVVRGPLKGGRSLPPNELSVNAGGEIHIVAAGRGSGGGRGAGTGKIIVGAILIAAAAFFTFGGAAAGMATVGAAQATAAGSVAAGTVVTSAAGYGTAVGIGFGFSIGTAQIALMGAALMFGGISSLLAPTPRGNQGGPQDTKPSYLFNGQVNMADQGAPVPLLFGRGRIPGIVISLGLDTVALPT